MASEVFPFSFKEQLFFVVLVSCYVLFNLAVLPVEQFVLEPLSNTPWGTCAEAWVIGCYMAQIGILGCWTAMFAGSLILRLLIANLLLVLVYIPFHWLMESTFLDVLQMRQEWFKPIGWATLVVCLNGLLVPLLILRCVSGYSLLQETALVKVVRVRQFSVSEILGLMSLVTVPLFILSSVLVPLVDAPFLLAIVIATGAISWLFLWFGLRPQISVAGLTAMLMLGPVIIWVVFGLCLGIWTRQYMRAPIYWIYVACYLGVITQVVVALFAARMIGYRLLKSAMPSEA